MHAQTEESLTKKVKADEQKHAQTSDSAIDRATHAPKAAAAATQEKRSSSGAKDSGHTPLPSGLRAAAASSSPPIAPYRWIPAVSSSRSRRRFQLQHASSSDCAVSSQPQGDRVSRSVNALLRVRRRSR